MSKETPLTEAFVSLILSRLTKALRVEADAIVQEIAAGREARSSSRTNSSAFRVVARKKTKPRKSYGK